MHHISEEGFKTINWLPVIQRVLQSLNDTVFKYVNNACPYCMKEVFEYASQGRISSRNNYASLKVTFLKTTMGQKSLFIYWSLSLEQIAKFNEKKHCLKYVQAWFEKTLITRIKDLILLSSLSLLLILLSLLFLLLKWLFIISCITFILLLLSLTLMLSLSLSIFCFYHYCLCLCNYNFLP